MGYNRKELPQTRTMSGLLKMIFVSGPVNSEQDQDLISINTGKSMMLANNQICLLAVSIMSMLHLGSQVKSRLLIGQQCRIKIINLNKILAFSARVLFRVEELRLVVPTENSVFADLSTINRAIAWLIDERHILPSKSGIYEQYGDIYQCGRSLAVRRSRDKVLQGDWLRSQ